MSHSLPEFERPPLDEVAIGIQFEPLKSFHAAHLGRYWSRIRNRYPFTEDQPPIVPQIEAAELKPGPSPGAFAIGAIPPIRSWFMDKSKNQLVQLQNDRFLRNWRQLEGNDTYPRYAYLIKEFRREWEGFLSFLQEEAIDAPVVNQCEITYINKLAPGTGWKDNTELAKVFSFLRAPPAQGFLPAPEFFSWDARYKLPENQGRLRVKMLPAFQARDLTLIFILDLTARGAPAEKTAASIFAWFDLAHEWIVRGFDEVTESEMHKAWGKKS
jgi:uncharacterized protein (TIGR04255 family)